MELNKVWAWKQRKLACRIRVETGNPTGDDLRERFAELAGADLREVLLDMKNTKKKKEAADKLTVDHDADTIFKSLEKRSHILGATQKALGEMENHDAKMKESFTQRNLNKVYTLLPKSPPKRILKEIQRERSKPLKLPDQNESNEATARLQRRLAKQRAAIKAAMNSDGADKASSTSEFVVKRDSKGKIIVRKIMRLYSGDQFGTGGPYLKSMIYMSRMKDSLEKSIRKPYMPRIEDVLNIDLSEQVKALNKSQEMDSRSGNDGDGVTVQEDSLVPDGASKHYCATVLCNWSRNSLNADRLASEGAVRAIITLFQEPDPKTIRYCAATFRFMSEYTPTAIALIEEAAIPTIGDVLQQKGDDDFVVSNLAVTLINITRVPGKEASVVDGGIVLTLMNLIALRPELSAACARGLYNLTCVDGPYLLIERVIRALVSLSSSNTSSVKHICAASLCNLSDLKLVRARLVEEGVVNILTSLSRGAETRTRRICAVILQNLSASKGCRVDMTSRNSVNVAYGLSSDPDPIIQRAISLTLSRLAQEPVNISRIIYENGVIALCNIGTKYANIPGVSEPVAIAFQLLSHRGEARQSFIGDGCTVSCLASLLRLSTDLTTIQQTLLALSNLLIEPESHTSVIQSGLLVTILNLCNHENVVIREICSLALLNFSNSEDSRKHLINGGIISAIVSLVGTNNVITRRRCSAALCKISYFVPGRSRMVDDGIIPCLVSLVLSEDLETVHHACSAICRLCCSELNGKLMMEANAIPNCIKGAMNNDTTTMRYCGSVLSALSNYEICRIPLIECGIMKVLKRLSNSNDNIIKQRCLVAYANLSCETSVHVTMVNEGVIKIISELAESYQEINYICCAKAMCNLACNKEVRSRITIDGGVYTLLMISMVHSVDKETKLLCIISLINLLEEATLPKMLDEGIIPAVTNNSKIVDSRIEYHCAILFNQLSSIELSRVKMTEKTSYLTALFDMIKNPNMDIKIIAAKTCCNLALCPKSRAKTVIAGVLPVLEVGILLGDAETTNLCLNAMFAVSQDVQFLANLSSQGSIPSTLANVVLGSLGEDHNIALNIILRISFDKSAKVKLQNASFVQVLINIVERNLNIDNYDNAVKIFRFLVHGYENHMELLNLGFFNSLWTLYRSVSNVCLIQISEILRVLVTSEKYGSQCVDALGNSSTISLISHIIATLPNEPEVIENISFILLSFVSSGSSETRVRMGNREIAAALLHISQDKRHWEVAIACIGSNLFEPAVRSNFANLEFARKLYEVINSNPSEDLLYNSVSCIFAMTKVQSCLEHLTSPELQLDNVIAKILQGKANQKVKANCSRALKNLASDSTGAIEEGSVSTLISMNLEGRNKSKVGGDIILPSVVPLSIAKVAIPDSTYTLPDSCFWSMEIELKMAGSAGMGPEPPEPPALLIGCCESYNNLMEDLDTMESDGKTKMAFAKMPIPADLKTKHVLTDADFDNSNKDDESEAKEDSIENLSLSAPDSELKVSVPDDTLASPGNRARTSSRSRTFSSEGKAGFNSRRDSKIGGSNNNSPMNTPTQSMRKSFTESPDAKASRSRASSFRQDAKGGASPSETKEALKSASKAKSLKNVKESIDQSGAHNLYT